MGASWANPEALPVTANTTSHPRNICLGRITKPTVVMAVPAGRDNAKPGLTSRPPAFVRTQAGP